MRKLPRSSLSRLLRARAAITVTVMVWGASGCGSPQSTAKEFCVAHTTQQFGEAYDMFAKKDRGEISKMDYISFEWDQKTFDLHILRTHNNCSSEVLVPGETETLMTIKLTSMAHARQFSCVLPMVKEDDGWRITRHFEAMEKFAAELPKARRALNDKLRETRELDNEAYTAAAATAMKSYWGAVDAARAEVAAAAGGEFPVWCHGALNLDGGRDLAYDYLAFQEQEEKETRPKQLVEKAARYKKIIDTVRGDYKPVMTVVQNGVRFDVITATVELGDKDIGPLVTYMISMVGDIETPLSWRLFIYSQGKLTHEGTGSEPDIINDVGQFLPDAPELNLLVFEFPKKNLPAGTDKLDLTLADAMGIKEFTIELPVKSEFLAPKAN